MYIYADSEPILVAATDLTSLTGGIVGGVLEEMQNRHNWSLGSRDPGPNLKVVYELGESNIATATEHSQSVEVVGVDTILELDVDEAPVVWSRSGMGLDGESIH